MSGTKQPKPYWNPYVAGITLGVLLFVSFYLVGDGLGASGGIAHVSVAVEKVVAPTHVNETAFLAKLGGGDKNPLNNSHVFTIIGIILGGLASGILGRRLKLETFRGPRINDKTRWIIALAGGLLMGWGARLARGCTSGQGLTGCATGAVGSWLFFAMIFVGGFLIAFPLRRLWR